MATQGYKDIMDFGRFSKDFFSSLTSIINPEEKDDAQHEAEQAASAELDTNDTQAVIDVDSFATAADHNAQFARKPATIQQYERLWIEYRNFLAARLPDNATDNDKDYLALLRDGETPRRINSFLCYQCDMKDLKHKDGTSVGCKGKSVYHSSFLISPASGPAVPSRACLFGSLPARRDGRA